MSDMVTAAQLRSFIERVERPEEEKAALVFFGLGFLAALALS